MSRPTEIILNPGSNERPPGGIVGPFARAVFDPAWNRVSVYLFYRGPTGDVYVQSAPTVAPCAKAEPGGDADRSLPFLSLRDEEAKSLMDSLWDAGIRPTASRDRVETIAAKDAHIADLKSILDRVVPPRKEGP